MTHQGHGYTYDELDRRVNRRVNALAAAGVAPGTRVASLLGDPLAITELYLAQAKLGAVLVALNPYWTDDVLVAVVEFERLTGGALRRGVRTGDRADPRPAQRRWHMAAGRGAVFRLGCAAAHRRKR